VIADDALNVIDTWTNGQPTVHLREPLLHIV
jgi:hypothetical protein